MWHRPRQQGDCTGCEAQGHSQGRAREDGPGEVTSKRGPEERLVVGCRLGEILFYPERSQREHAVLGNCQQVHIPQSQEVRVEVGEGPGEAQAASRVQEGSLESIQEQRGWGGTAARSLSRG